MENVTGVKEQDITIYPVNAPYNPLVSEILPQFLEYLRVEETVVKEPSFVTRVISSGL